MRYRISSIIMKSSIFLKSFDDNYQLGSKRESQSPYSVNQTKTNSRDDITEYRIFSRNEDVDESRKSIHYTRRK